MKWGVIYHSTTYRSFFVNTIYVIFDFILYYNLIVINLSLTKGGVLLNPTQLAAALAAGIITQDEHDNHLSAWNAQQKERDEVEKAEAWYDELEKAPLAQKKKMVKEQAFNLQVKSGLTQDRQESNRIRRTASSMRYALRGSGGISF